MAEFRILRTGLGYRWYWYGHRGRLLAVGRAYPTEAEARAELADWPQERPPAAPTPAPGGRRYAPARRP